MKRLIGYTSVLCLLALTVGCGGVTSNGTLAYISNSQGTGFTVYNVNTNGTLTTSSISPQNTPAAPKVLQFSPNGKWAYFLDASGDNLYAYVRSGNGTLGTLVGQYPTIGPASSMIVAPSSNYVYVAEPSVAVPNNGHTGVIVAYSVDPSSGILTGGQAINVGYAIQQLVVSPSGSLLFGLSPSQQTIVSWNLNSTSGLATEVAKLSVGTDPVYMVLSANGSYMYVLDYTGTTTITNVANCGEPPNVVPNCTSTPGPSPNIYAYTVGTGTLQAISGSNLTPGVFNENADLATGIFPNEPIAGVTSSDSRFLFVVNQGTKNISVFRIGSSTSSAGELTEVLGSLSTINGISTSTASPFPCTGCVGPSFIAAGKLTSAFYVLDETAGKVFQFAVNQNSGVIRELNPAFVSAESATSAPTWITIR